MSASILSRLEILLHANTARAVDELRSFGGQAKSALADVKKHAKAVAVGIGAGASAAAVAVASVTKEHITLANELQKTARIANTTASEIQKYTFAAKAMGIEQDKLGDIFKDTQDKVGDFLTTGGGEMMDFFENIAPQIGITAKEFRNLSGADALQLYYTSLEKANLSQSEMIFYMESVADEASLLIPLLANGGEGFKLWSDMASRAGAVMSEETLVATQKLTASTEIMNLMWQGAKNNFVSAVIPALSDVAGELIKNGNTAQFAKQAGESLVITLKFMAKGAILVANAFRTVGQFIGGTFAGFARFAQTLNFDSPMAFLKSIADAGANAWNVWGDTTNTINNIWSGLGDTFARIDKLGTGATNAQVQAVMNLTTARQKYNAQLGKTGSELAKQREEAEKLAKEQEKIAKSKKANNFVSNSALQGLKIKSGESTAGGKVKEATAEFARLAQEQIGGNLKYFSAFNDRYHIGRKSHHNQGMAFDIVLKDARLARQTVKELQSLANEYGYTVKILDEYAKPSKHSTGGHLHISVLDWYQKSGGKSGAKESLAKAKSILKDQVANAILWGANELKIDPNYLASVISFETGGTFSTNARNPKSSGTGLIQFMDYADGKTDKRYYGMTRDQFGSLSHMEQMKYVVKYFKEKGLQAGASLGDVYDAVTGTGYRKGTKAYELNKVWDANKDGYIAKGESVKSGAFKAHIKDFFSDTRVSQEQLGEWQTNSAKEAEDTARRQLAIARDYADKRKLIELDLQAEIDKIKQAGFDADTESRYIAQAKQRASIELATFETAQTEKLHGLMEYRLTEEQAIKANFAKERLAILNNAELALAENENYRERLLRAIDEKERYELDKFRLTQDQKRLELDEANLSELARIKARYELERREMALSNHSLKDEMIAQSHRDEASEIGQLQKGHRDSTTGLFADLTGNSNLLQVQQEYQARKQIIDEALANEAISFAEHHAMLAMLERTAYESRRQVITEGMQGVAGSLTQITGDLLGKQSKAYRVMFAVEKGFAIARSVMAIQTGIAQAAALPFPANFPAMASVISATASIISTLQSVRQPIGQAHDGIMSVPESGTWNLQKGERVLPQYTAKRLDKTLDNLQGGQGVQVVINNYTSSNVEATTDDDGKLKILITNEINKQVPSQLANPNSPISKGLKNNWQIAPKR